MPTATRVVPQPMRSLSCKWRIDARGLACFAAWPKSSSMEQRQKSILALGDSIEADDSAA
eukprot:CAMPEP_0180483580 /NCGR_PEP_ID=MMETSP1036_2-20121128/35499_1 /TAXON_ID=632150 /ORGANISM="Azadinium spinosum, Strain 3D9" /LENGTH=59 /DNA_ID=CAMNT_0022491399 /DNA_START=47 /DNA_END=226 /DNA_ORIENTATION=+